MIVFCSTIVGGEFLTKHPEVPIDNLLLELDVLDTRTNDARAALVKEDNEDGVVQSAKALGRESLYGVSLVLLMKGRLMPFMMSDDDACTYLTAAVQQLETLLLLLKEEYKPVCG